MFVVEKWMIRGRYDFLFYFMIVGYVGLYFVVLKVDLMKFEVLLFKFLLGVLLLFEKGKSLVVFL